jgi:hypothetical protein
LLSFISNWPSIYFGITPKISQLSFPVKFEFIPCLLFD